jgi:hypothetical protein
MELRCWYIFWLALGLSSCNWFNPYDVPNNDEDFRFVTYFLPIESDSSVCFMSRAVDFNIPNIVEPYDVCAHVKSVGGDVVSCGLVEADTARIWLGTGGIVGVEPGDSLLLEVESPTFKLISAATVVPEKASIVSYSMTSRSFFDGGKYFDEFLVELADPTSREEAFMFQLISHIDTIGAPAPVLMSMKSDDTNMIRRTFGRSALDNTLFFDDSFWKGGDYTFSFRTRNKVEEGVPYHFTLLVHSISIDMFKYFRDLENSGFSGQFDGSGNVIHTNINGAQGCFGALQTSHVLLFP